MPLVRVLERVLVRDSGSDALGAIANELDLENVLGAPLPSFRDDEERLRLWALERLESAPLGEDGLELVARVRTWGERLDECDLWLVDGDNVDREPAGSVALARIARACASHPNPDAALRPIALGFAALAAVSIAGSLDPALVLGDRSDCPLVAGVDGLHDRAGEGPRLQLGWLLPDGELELEAQWLE